VAPKVAGEGGRLAEKVPAIMTIPAKGYEFPAEIAPRPGDVLIPKKHPSAFFGTAMVSHLIDLNVDTLVMTGCTTSGCVRASTVDAFAYNFKVVVPEDAVYDRSRVSHSVNLFDMAEKYADVMPSAEVLKRIEALSPRATARAAE
jgi:nicotinamidase-related amidase